MAKEIYIRGVITPNEYKEDEKLIGNNDTYSYADLVSDIGEDTDGTIYIDSPGGMVEEGLKMYQHLKNLNFDTVAINASSIASILFLSGKNRKVSSNAEMIIHNAWIHGEEINDLTINANVLDELKTEFEKMDSELVAIYKNETGLDESKLLALMAVDTDIASQAVELGFANSIYKEESEPRKAMNKYIMFNLKSVEMANENQEERLNAIEKVLSKVSNVVTALFGAKAMVETLEDGTELYIFSEDGEFAGKKAVLAEGGEPTESLAPAGTHKLRDGREIVVGEGGMIESVKEAPNVDEMEASIIAMEEEKKELMNAKAEIEEKLNAMAKAKEESEENFKTQIEEITKELKALKEETIGTVEEDIQPKAMSKEEFSKLSVSEKFKLNLMAKAGN